MNYHRLYGLKEFAEQAYGNLGKPGQWIKGQPAGACLECGECEPRCPQKLPIMAQLKEVARTLGR